MFVNLCCSTCLIPSLIHVRLDNLILSLVNFVDEWSFVMAHVLQLICSTRIDNCCRTRPVVDFKNRKTAECDDKFAVKLASL